MSIYKLTDEEYEQYLLNTDKYDSEDEPVDYEADYIVSGNDDRSKKRHDKEEERVYKQFEQKPVVRDQNLAKRRVYHDLTHDEIDMAGFRTKSKIALTTAASRKRYQNYGCAWRDSQDSDAKNQEEGISYASEVRYVTITTRPGFDFRGNPLKMRYMDDARFRLEATNGSCGKYSGDRIGNETLKHSVVTSIGSEGKYHNVMANSVASESSPAQLSAFFDVEKVTLQPSEALSSTSVKFFLCFPQAGSTLYPITKEMAIEMHKGSPGSWSFNDGFRERVYAIIDSLALSVAQKSNVSHLLNTGRVSMCQKGSFKHKTLSSPGIVYEALGRGGSRVSASAISSVFFVTKSANEWYADGYEDSTQMTDSNVFSTGPMAEVSDIIAHDGYDTNFPVYTNDVSGSGMPFSLPICNFNFSQMPLNFYYIDCDDFIGGAQKNKKLKKKIGKMLTKSQKNKNAVKRIRKIVGKGDYGEKLVNFVAPMVEELTERTIGSKSRHDMAINERGDLGQAAGRLFKRLAPRLIDFVKSRFPLADAFMKTMDYAIHGSGAYSSSGIPNNMQQVAHNSIVSPDVTLESDLASSSPYKRVTSGSFYYTTVLAGSTPSIGLPKDRGNLSQLVIPIQPLEWAMAPGLISIATQYNYFVFKGIIIKGKILFNPDNVNLVCEPMVMAGYQHDPTSENPVTRLEFSQLKSPLISTLKNVDGFIFGVECAPKFFPMGPKSKFTVDKADNPTVTDTQGVVTMMFDTTATTGSVAPGTALADIYIEYIVEFSEPKLQLGMSTGFFTGVAFLNPGGTYAVTSNNGYYTFQRAVGSLASPTIAYRNGQTTFSFWTEQGEYLLITEKFLWQGAATYMQGQLVTDLVGLSYINDRAGVTNASTSVNGSTVGCVAGDYVQGNVYGTSPNGTPSILSYGVEGTTKLLSNGGYVSFTLSALACTAAVGNMSIEVSIISLGVTNTFNYSPSTSATSILTGSNWT